MCEKTTKPKERQTGLTTPVAIEKGTPAMSYHIPSISDCGGECHKAHECVRLFLAISNDVVLYLARPYIAGASWAPVRTLPPDIWVSVDNSSGNDVQRIIFVDLLLHY